MSQVLRPVSRQDSSPISSDSSTQWSFQQNLPQNRHANPIRHIDGALFSCFPQRSSETKLDFDKEWPKILKIVEDIANDRNSSGYAFAKSVIDALLEDNENMEKITEYLKTILKKTAETRISRILKAHDLTEFTSIVNSGVKKNVLIISIFQQWEKKNNIKIKDMLYSCLRSEIETHSGFLDHVIHIICQAFTKSRQDPTLFKTELEKSVKFVAKIDKTPVLVEAITNEVKEYFQCHPLDTNLGPLLFLSNAGRLIANEEQHLSVFPEYIAEQALNAARKYIYVDYFKFSMQTIVEALIIEKPAYISDVRTLCEQSGDPTLLKSLYEHLHSAFKDRVTAFIKQNQSSAVAQIIDLLAMVKKNREDAGAEIHNLTMKTIRDTLNKSSSQVSYMIAKYSHTRITDSPNEFMANKNKIIDLLSLLESTDVFLDYYKRFLGQRLLTNSEILEIETELLKDLGQFSKHNDIFPFYTMMSDVKQSIQLNEEFNHHNSIGFSVSFISAYSWPHYPFVSVNIPEEVVDSRNKFIEFMKSRKKCTIRWLDALESVTFQYRKVTFKSATLQFLVLRSIVECGDPKVTGIQSNYLQEIVGQLAKSGLIAKKNGKFVANPFKVTKSSVKFPPLGMVITGQKKERNEEDVFKGRKESIRMSIVCTLKKWNELPFDVLFDEAKRIFKFPINESDFKIFIDDLIATDVIVKGTNGNYRYCS